MKFILPPMTPNDAATSVLNTCMHLFNNKQTDWTDARAVLISLMQDMYELGYRKTKSESEQKLPEVQVLETKPATAVDI